MASEELTLLALRSNFEHWESGGRDASKHQLASLVEIASTRSANATTEKFTLYRFLYEICTQAVYGKLPVTEVASFLREHLEKKTDSGVDVFADLLGVMDVELCTRDDKSQRGNFLALLRECTDFVTEPVLKVHLEIETLQAMGLIANQKAFDQRYIKVKTRLFYRQEKFNLLREESEGYSKLLTELGEETSGTENPTDLLQRIMALIGHFSLDPNRVLDILLEALECHEHKDQLLLPILRVCNSSSNNLCQLLGFKFQNLQSAAEETPPSLYRAAAVLLKNDLVKIEEVYKHLSPSDESIIRHHKQTLQKARQQAKKTTISTLAKEDEPMDVDPEVSRDNQKIGLVQALLEVGHWRCAEWMMLRLPPFTATAKPGVARALCQLLHYILEPVYRRIAPKPAKGQVPLFQPATSGRPTPDCCVCQCETYEDMSQYAFPILTQLGMHLATDPVLLGKILRLGREFMHQHWPENAQATSDPLCLSWLDAMDEVILPALSLLPCNCSLAEETWNLLKVLPYQIRYRLYGQWKNQSYHNHLPLLQARASTLERARYVMKRLTKESVKQSGRQLGKLSHSNPGVLFEYVLSQIQTYDNFITPVVDSLKYLTPLAYDVLAYCIIEALANPDKQKMKHEDTNLSQWLQGLAQFCGTVMRKYSIELTGLLQYVANQLKAGKSFDLLVLKEVVVKMSGIELMEEVTQSQVDALAGGELLRAEGGYFSQVRNTKKSSQRLRETLMDAALGVPLCLLIAQQRESVIFVEATNCHLKLLGKLYDQCQDTLVQFGGFLSTYLTPTDYNNKVPPIDELMRTYHLQTDTAFFLDRPRLAFNIHSRVESLKRAAKSKSESVNESEAVDIEVKSLIETIRPLIPSKDISAQLFATFWSLSLYDIWVPEQRYQDEMAHQEQAGQELDNNQELNAGKRKKEKERCDMMIKRLGDELNRQKEHHERVMLWLKDACKTWFQQPAQKNRMVTQFLQQCIFPRCCFTAIDAVYCAKFVQIMHDLKTPHFSTLLYYDRVFSDVSYTVACCTENEASRYGRFLCCILEAIVEWHGNRATYEKKCKDYPGFISVMRADSVQKLEYEDFRHICFKWHYKITKSMVSCLESRDYTQIRNAILVLIKILPHYPLVNSLGVALEKRIDQICEQEKEQRADLAALAKSYAGQLRNRKSHFILESQFHNKEEREKALQEANEARKQQLQQQQGPPSEAAANEADTETSAAEQGRTHGSSPRARSPAVSDSSDKVKSSTSTASLATRPTASNAMPSPAASTTTSRSTSTSTTASSERQEPAAVKRSSTSSRESLPAKSARTSDAGLPLTSASAENGTSSEKFSNATKKEAAKKPDASRSPREGDRHVSAEGARNNTSTSPGHSRSPQVHQKKARYSVQTARETRDEPQDKVEMKKRKDEAVDSHDAGSRKSQKEKDREREREHSQEKTKDRESHEKGRDRDSRESKPKEHDKSSKSERKRERGSEEAADQEREIKRHRSEDSSAKSNQSGKRDEHKASRIIRISGSGASATSTSKATEAMPVKSKPPTSGRKDKEKEKHHSRAQRSSRHS